MVNLGFCKSLSTVGAGNLQLSGPMGPLYLFIYSLCVCTYKRFMGDVEKGIIASVYSAN